MRFFCQVEVGRQHGLIGGGILGEIRTLILIRFLSVGFFWVRSFHRSIEHLRIVISLMDFSPWVLEDVVVTGLVSLLR